MVVVVVGWRLTVTVASSPGTTCPVIVVVARGVPVGANVGEIHVAEILHAPDDHVQLVVVRPGKYKEVTSKS